MKSFFYFLKFRNIRLVSVFAGLLFSSVVAYANLLTPWNFTLYINGRAENGAAVNDYYDWRYWGGKRTDGGRNMRAINWDGTNNVASTNLEIRKALDCYCTGNNWCSVVAHSAGNLQIGYAIDYYGGTKRTKMSGKIDGATKQCIRKPDESGVARDQTGWNINAVAVAGGAAGGSTLARLGSIWLGGIVDDLVPTTARSMYDHNDTRGIRFEMFAGAKGAAQSFLMSGQDDAAVNYASAGGVSGGADFALCNPGNPFCPELTFAKDPAGGRAKWNSHYVRFRDTKEEFDHFARGAWQGIISQARNYANWHF